ncbi:hypothetical protein [uncultured Pseudomonas sp.]|uniref:hypothetical protein n=1 Tax=uncultured Pseudomonas sp. TaxID=114707 RepID=UPI000C943F46|nr:hypothetical protein [Pseudomonadales bacterium]|tara:strand:+ start:1353 stop:1631 length:279 start_codon:yes stop_codon:yes gene_type:complete
MSPLQAAWLYYLAHPALTINSLALFFSANGSWLWLATQLRGASRANRMTATPQNLAIDSDDNASRRADRLFYRVGGASLALGLLLSLISTQL